ncbi:MAG: hypothetical protein AAF441_17785 [Pseudomonadota bacterium]
MYYISITGLRLKSIWSMVRFWRHAIASLRQVRQAEGLVHAEVRRISGVQHTLTVWQDERAMKRFLYRGAHRKAIAAFDSIATGKTFGYHSADIPDWEEARALWEEYGAEYVSSGARQAA